MRSFHNSAFDPLTLLLLETAFDEAWLTLKFVGNKTVKPDELARSVLRVAMKASAIPFDCRTKRWSDCYPRPPGARRTDRAAIGLIRPMTVVQAATLKRLAEAACELVDQI